ncbi:MAG: lipocalin-like domain-containing protein [Patescibacteria group bacterium]|nr:lipocalin-like domain-containing protein [Patescibacteria group bacterium]
MTSLKPITFPQDHQAHESIIEWWYFNGLLRDKNGQQYSFMDCLFKANLKKVGIPFLNKIKPGKISSSSPYIFFAHSVVSDIAKQKSYKEIQNFSVASRDSFTKPRLFVNYTNPILIVNYVNNEIAETEPNCFHLKTENIDLQLASKKPALFEGGQGHITVCGRQSYYYSLTDLQVHGTIIVDGRRVEVDGRAWMDHQWADVKYAKDKWTWFSLQLDDGTDIMCVEYDDGKTKDYLVDVLDASGTSSHFERMVLTSGSETWNSSKTKTKFPMAWEIGLPDLTAKLAVRSMTTADQEMIFGSINYWEGPIAVSGTINGKKVKGFGFMELVGFPSNYNYLLLTGKEFHRKFWKRVGKTNSLKS